MTINHAGPLLESALFKGARFGVMLSLCNHADDFGECFPSYYAIAAEARCSRRQAMREVEWLNERGCIEIIDPAESGGDKAARRSNVYRINLALVRTMYNLAREAKTLAGRNPAKRWKHVLAIAAWSEKIIDESGAKTLVETAGKILIDGDTMSLLQNCNSDAMSPSADGNGDIGGAGPSKMSPEPSIEPSIEPSSDARARGGDPGGPPRASAGGRAEGAGSTDGAGDKAKPFAPERIRVKARDAILHWLLTGDVARLDALMLKTSLTEFERFRVPGFDLDGQEAEQFVLRLPYYAKSGVVEAVAWVTRWIAGDDPKEPAPPFKPLEAHFRRWPEYASRDKRIERLTRQVEKERAERANEQQAENQNAEDAA